MRAFQLQRGFGRGNRDTLVAVVHNLDGATGFLAQLAHMRLRQRSVTAIDVTNDVGVGF